MRTRSRSLDPTVIPCRLLAERIYYGDGHHDIAHDTFREYSESQSETMTDRKTPGFFKAQREGGVIPVSPMTKTEVKVDYEPGSCTFQWEYADKPSWAFDQKVQASGVASDYSCYNECVNLRVNSSAPLADKYLQEALARAQTDAWDTATFLAEFHKTVEGVVTLRARVQKLFSTIVAAARSKKRASKLPRTLYECFEEVWLSARYEWRPLLYDLRDMQTALRRLAEGIENPLARGWSSSDELVDSASSFVYGSMALGTKNQSSQAWDNGLMGRLSVCRKIVTYRPRATAGVQVTTRAINYMDPLITSWELVPFSFIIDWFVTIGDLLAAFSPFATGTLKYATWTLEMETTLEVESLIEPRSQWPWNVKGGSDKQFTSKISWRSVSRDRSIREPRPTLEFALNLDKAKIFDLIAIFRKDASRFHSTLRG